jgi:ParB family chromosome partitioning protein
MNKRTDRIRSLFAQQPAPMLSADNTTQDGVRVASGSVKAVKESFSIIERENDALREQLAGKSAIREIDAALIEPSPVADRLVSENDRAFEDLRNSMRDHGQEIPVLLRPHPQRQGQYQIAYGHRRVRAARELGIPVKAVVRVLDDDQLVVAQGLENAAREDLSFIERALFAERLEAQGFSRAVIQEALVIDRAEASKLIAVARAIPADIVLAIGKAPRVGRGRWQEFAEALGGSAATSRIHAAIGLAGFEGLASDERFSALLAAARKVDRIEKPQMQTIASTDGRTIAHVRETKRGAVLSLDGGGAGGFGAFLKGRLPALFAEFEAEAHRNNH